MYLERSVSDYKYDLLNLESVVMSNGNGQGENEWDEDGVRAILFNPVYTMGSSPAVSNEQWVAAQRRLVDEFGVEPYLNRLLSVIQETFADVVE